MQKKETDIPMMMVRMRCPVCEFDFRFMVQMDTPIVYLPEITKKVMRCRCDNHIPKIGKNTPIENTLMSINAVPLRLLLERNRLRNLDGNVIEKSK